MKTVIRVAKLNKQIKEPVIRVLGGIATSTDYEQWASAPCALPDGVYTLQSVELWQATGADPVPCDMDFHDPKIEVAQSETITVKVSDLTRVSHAQGKTDVRYYLNGTCLDLSTGVVVATDGCRMAMVEQAFAPIPGRGQVIVPRETIKTIVQQAGKVATVDITIDYTEREAIGKDAPAQYEAARIRTAGGRSKLIGGKFPDYRRVVPARNARPVIGTGDVMAVVTEAAKIAKVMKSKFAACTLSLDGCRLDNQPMAARFGFAGFTIGVNAGYLLDAIKAAPDSEIRGADANSSLLLIDGDFTQVVMPMRT